MEKKTVKRRGRPKGSKNKTKRTQSVQGKRTRQRTANAVTPAQTGAFKLEIDRAGIKFAYSDTI